MFARLFPLDVERIVHEAYDGALSALVALPVSISLGVVQRYLVKSLIPFLSAEDAEKHIVALETQKQYILPDSYSVKFVASFVGPVIEEFLFRGALTPVLQSVLSSMNLNPSYAPLLTSMIFASLHHTNRLSILYLGRCFEGLTSSHEGSLWPSITAHSLNNLVTLLFLSPTADAQRKECEDAIKHIETVNFPLRQRLFRQRLLDIDRQLAALTGRECHVASVAMGPT